MLPPRRSALAPIYWKLSMLITSMMGQTTRLLSSTTRASKGSNQSWFENHSGATILEKLTLLHSQCESRKVRMPDVAASAPFTRDLISPSRFSFLRTRTFWIAASSSPSAAAIFIWIIRAIFSNHWNNPFSKSHLSVCMKRALERSLYEAFTLLVPHNHLVCNH